MLATTTAGTWGITGAQFLWGYGALGAATAIGVWQAYRRALGPLATGSDPLPVLGIPELALLNGGPDGAVTAAATQLYRDGSLLGMGGVLTATGELRPDAPPLEREVFEAVGREPWMSLDRVRDAVREAPAVRDVTDRMTRNGLLLDEAARRRIRLLWIVPALLALLGAVRILAGLSAGRPVLVLCAMTAVAAMAACALLRMRPVATSRGRRVLERLRAERDPAGIQAVPGESALTLALFGAGALWIAEPGVAAALGVPREEGALGFGSANGSGCGTSGGGGCGGGCGGCGGCGG